METIRFTRINDTYRKGWYRYQSGDTEVLFTLTDDNLQFDVRVWETYRNLECTIGHDCPYSGTGQCDWQTCNRLVDYREIREHINKTISYAEIGSIMNMNEDNDNPVMRLLIARTFITKLLYDNEFSENLYGIALNAEHADINDFLCKRWNLDGILI